MQKEVLLPVSKLLMSIIQTPPLFCNIFPCPIISYFSTGAFIWDSYPIPTRSWTGPAFFHFSHSIYLWSFDLAFLCPVYLILKGTQFPLPCTKSLFKLLQCPFIVHPSLFPWLSTLFNLLKQLVFFIDQRDWTQAGVWQDEGLWRWWRKWVYLGGKLLPHILLGSCSLHLMFVLVFGPKML